MASAQNIVCNDRASTPVTHTFVPFGKNSAGVVEFREAGTIPLGDRVITASSRKTSAGKYQTKLKLAVPVYQESGVATIPATVIRTAYVEVTTTFDGSSTVQERKDALAMMINALTPGTNTWLLDGTITANGGLY